MPSPLDPDFAYKRYLQKRQQVEDWQVEHGLNVPVDLLDECSEARDYWLARDGAETSQNAAFDGPKFEQQLKQFEAEWAKEARQKERGNAEPRN